jgi:CheY-like chemotaxis protein
VLLEVSDTGKGMDPGTRARVFEPFFTTKPNGTGLGLSTVHGIVAQAGGTIDIQSEPGRGTTFRISLEATSELPEAVPRGDPRTTVRRRGGSGEVIVVVEDEDALRGVVCRALTRSGYRTREAADGNAALQLLSAEESMPDLIITDIGLPDMDGIELADRVRRIVPKMLILYTSGHSEEEVIRKFALARPQAFLEKPYSVQALLAKVGETIGSAAT